MPVVEDVTEGSNDGRALVVVLVAVVVVIALDFASGMPRMDHSPMGSAVEHDQMDM